METVIGIATYFGSNMLMSCIASIMANVKNPKIFVFKNDIGWLKACNQIMKQTTDDLILLNDDTYILTDIVEEMNTLAYSSSKIGIVGGKSLSHNEMVNNYGIYIAPDGNTAHKYFGKRRDEIKTVEIQKAVEGSCMFIKREVIDTIGIFDEKYGMGYRAEVSYCFSAREKGYLVVSSPKAEYVHFVSQTSMPLGITNDTHEIFMQEWGTKLALGLI